MSLLDEFLSMIHSPNRIVINCNNFYTNVGINHETNPVGYQTALYSDSGLLYFNLNYRATAGQYSTIYHFPFRPSIPGYCIPQDTKNLIITNVMNGCSIELFQVQEGNRSHVLFLHNGNERQLANEDTKIRLLEDINERIFPNSSIRINLFNPSTQIMSGEYMANVFNEPNIKMAYWIPIIKQYSPGNYDFYFFCCAQYMSQDNSDSRFFLNRELSRIISVRGFQKQETLIFP